MDFRNTLRAHLDGLGLTDLHFHGLRHTTAAALAEFGGSMPRSRLCSATARGNGYPYGVARFAAARR